MKEALEQWIEFANLGAATRQRSERLVAAIEAEGATTPELKKFLRKTILDQTFSLDLRW